MYSENSSSPFDPKHFPSVMAFVATDDSSAMWRVWQPIAMLQRMGYPAEWTYVQDTEGVMLGALHDIIVMPRLQWPNKKVEDRFIKSALSGGKTLIYEMDDDMLVHVRWAYRPLSHAEQLQQTRFTGRLKSVLPRCHGVTVSVPRLKTTVEGFTDRPVKVVPNLIDWDWFTSVVSKAIPPWPDHLTIGWSGARRNHEDTLPLAYAWGRIAEEFPDVRFYIGGYQPEHLVAAVPEDRLSLGGWQRDLRLYPGQYVGIDIGCAPLANVPFNRCKSPIKAFEYAAAGAVVVYSPTVYSYYLTDDQHGLMAETEEEWYQALRAMVSQTERRETLRTQWAAEVRQRWSLGRNAGLWVDAWQHIWAQNKTKDLVRV